MKILEVCNSKMLFEENTGKWLVLEDEGYEIYKDNYQKEIIESEEIKEFIEEVNGYLNQKNLIDTKEKGLTVLLTNQCNLECIHCFYSSSSCKPKMLEFNEEYCDFFENYVKDGLKWVCFTGGEPLLNPQFSDFINHAAKYDVNISVMTNGILIKDEIADLLKKYNIYVQVSLDGTGSTYENVRKNGSYKRAIEGIKKLTDSGVVTDISFVPSRITIPDFDNVVNVAKKLHVNLLHMPFLEKYGRAEDNYDLLEITDDELKIFLGKIIEDYYSGKFGDVKVGFIENFKNQLLFPQIRESCKACQELALGVDYTNSIYPCSELIMDEYKIGHTNDSLEVIRNNFRKMICNLSNVSVNKVKKCRECTFKMLCGGGCRVQAVLTGGLYTEDKNCEVMQYLYMKMLEKIVELDINE